MLSIIILVKDKKEKILQDFSKEQNEKNNLKEIQILIQEGKHGRGRPIVTGIKKAKYDNILILHADTKLPKNYKELIEKTLKEYSAGCFSIENEIKTKRMKLILKIHDLYTIITKEMWGDRAIFFKKDTLNKKDLEKINVPLMEDVILSKILRKKAKENKNKIKILKEKVHSSGTTFKKIGITRYLTRIVKTRTKYALGIDVNKLYKDYYNQRN